MRDQLLKYYNNELTFIRRMAAQFAEKYPEVAGRLLLEPTKCEDPHVERMIDAFAMLAARVRLRLEDDFSEVSDALLSIIYPHYLAPIPSMMIVQLEVDPEMGASPGGTLVDRHSVLRSRPVNRVPCKFRTAYPLRLWPLEVRSVEIVPSNALGAEVPIDARSAVRIGLRVPEGVSLAELGIDALRFFLPSEGGSVHPLYELLLRNPRGVVLKSACEDESGARKEASILLGPHHVRPVGFEKNEGLLEYPTESFLGYRLLQEYFAFSEKFMFVELSGIEQLPIPEEASELYISVLLEDSVADLDLKVGPENVKLGCTPAVNLFPHTADPIRITGTQVEYELIPDVRSPGAFEVYSVGRVWSAKPGSAQVREFHPFYAIRHGQEKAKDAAYWSVSRRHTLRKDDSGTDVFLTLVDPSFDPYVPDIDALNVDTLCTNRDLPARLTLGDPRGDFSIEGRPEISAIRCLRNPTAPVHAPIREGSRWRIISHLALNYLSISGDDAGRANGSGSMAAGRSEERGLVALQEMLKLYDFADSAVTRNRINGLVGLGSRKVVRRIGRGAMSGFVRGLQVELEFDPHQYTGSGVFLLASVLERFLGLYTAVNSFTQTVVRVREREGILKRWPPRAGEIQIL